MTQAELKENKLVKIAESIGFVGYSENRNFRRHFYWHLPIAGSTRSHEFSVHQYKDGDISYRVREVGECGFTTSYEPEIAKRLNRIGDRVKFPG